jgi:hypothetical protein
VARSRSNGRSSALNNMRNALPGDMRSALPGRSDSRGFSLPKLPKRRSGLKGGVRKASRNLNQAAKQADQIGQRVSRVANAVQRVSETADDAAKKA